MTSERDLVEEVGTTRRLDEEEIRQESARTLDEALVRQPGVVVRTGADGVPRIDMRGLRTRHVLLLVDGIPVRNTEDGQFDPTLIPTEIIEDVKLSYGNSSVLYGDGPIGGVLQIRTRRGEEGLHGSLAGDARQRNQFLGQATVSGATRDLDVFAAGSVFDSDGFPLSGDFDSTPLENGSLRENSDRERQECLRAGRLDAHGALEAGPDHGLSQWRVRRPLERVRPVRPLRPSPSLRARRRFRRVLVPALLPLGAERSPGAALLGLRESTDARTGTATTTRTSIRCWTPAPSNKRVSP